MVGEGGWGVGGDMMWVWSNSDCVQDMLTKLAQTAAVGDGAGMQPVRKRCR